MSPRVDAALARRQGLTDDEFARVCRDLGREPTFEELGVFAALWSEHCSYKSSRNLLRSLPCDGPRIVQGPGENAGVVDLGPQRIAFKIESHNHPSFIEPYQGAATGVGGILRDIFAMGARPIALCDSLRFGDPGSRRMRQLIRGVVAGIAGYGNSVGVPTVAGECVFDPCYNGNILVNVLAVGAFEGRPPVKGAACAGCALVHAGARTGRDGIHGAVMASATFGDGNEVRRPAVQVGDPFLEKLLLEACLEAVSAGLVQGMQDLGAAGLSGAVSEMSHRGGVGAVVDLDRVPLRAHGMSAYEILLSESQERMLISVRPAHVTALKSIFEKWDLQAEVVGHALSGDTIQVTHGGRVVARLPVAPLTSGAPAYERPRRRPALQDELCRLDLATLEPPEDPTTALLALLGTPSVASKAWIWRQFDYQVGVRTLGGPGSDAAVLRLQGASQAISLSVDGNGRYCLLDPCEGAKAAVAEAARNVACSGALPVALTNCLNFGSPENPEVMWQFAEAVRGLGEAALALKTPVTGGNVSFYNETAGHSIHPTPVIGCLGLLEEPRRRVGPLFSRAGDAVVLLGEGAPTLGGSEYLRSLHGQTRGQPPSVDLGQERRLHELLWQAARRGLLRSVHDLGDGGLAVALAECCLGGLGADVVLDDGGRADLALFGERCGVVVASVDPATLSEVEKLSAEIGVVARVVGRVGGDRLRVALPTAWPRASIAVEVERLTAVHRNGLPRALQEDAV
jgi:phosphoribosylformylglycinamidine synthase II